jgi:flavodoxin
MKKTVVMALSFMMIFTLTACGGSNTAPSSENAPTTATQEPLDNSATSVPDTSVSSTGNVSGENILIAYFTNPEPDGVDAVARASRVVVNGEVVGNVQFIAQIIQQETGGSLFAIETVQPYPPRPELMDMGANEKNENARPELTAQVDNIDNYDVIFLGYPNWNADMPMALYTFLELHDFSGKTIIPFCPHGGSGFSGTIGSIADLQPNATVITSGFSVSRDNVPNSENDVVSWVRGLEVLAQ